MARRALRIVEFLAGGDRRWRCGDRVLHLGRVRMLVLRLRGGRERHEAEGESRHGGREPHGAKHNAHRTDPPINRKRSLQYNPEVLSSRNAAAFKVALRW